MPNIRIEQESVKLSRYEPGILTKAEMVEGIALIARTKPKLSPALSEFIVEAMRDENWSYQKMKDAVKYVAMNCPYPEPQPADYLNFDIFDELYTYQQMMDKVGREAYITMDFFQFVRKVGETSLYKYLGFNKTKNR